MPRIPVTLLFIVLLMPNWQSRVEAATGPAPLFSLLHNRIVELRTVKRRVFIVVDVEGALLNNCPRQLALLKLFAKRERKRYPRLRGQLKALTPKSCGPSAADTLNSIGAAAPGLLKAYLLFANPLSRGAQQVKLLVSVPGAVARIKMLLTAGAHLVLLSQSSDRSSKPVLENRLRQLGIPLGPKCELRLSKAGTDPTALKVALVEELGKIGVVLALFDGAITVCNAIKKRYPTVEVVLRRSLHRTDWNRRVRGVRWIPDFSSRL